MSNPFFYLDWIYFLDTANSVQIDPTWTVFTVPTKSPIQIQKCNLDFFRVIWIRGSRQCRNRNRNRYMEKNVATSTMKVSHGQTRQLRSIDAPKSRKILARLPGTEPPCFLPARIFEDATSICI